MDVSNTMPFFSKLKGFCNTIEKDVASIKNQLQQPIGSYPTNYDVGIKWIRKEIDQVKDQSKTINETIKSINDMKNYLDGKSSFIQKTEEDVEQLEAYLMKYGYQPLDLKTAEKEVEEDTLENEDVLRAEPVEKISKPITPVLSEIVKDLTSCKRLPHETPKREPLKRVEKETELEMDASFDDNPHVTNSLKKRVSDWLLEVPHSRDVTPELPSNDQAKINHSNNYYQRKLFTPEEGSEIKLESNTPEFPSLINTFNKKEEVFTNVTPEHPCLSAIDTPIKQNDYIPEQPMCLKEANSRYNRPTKPDTPEEVYHEVYNSTTDKFSKLEFPKQSESTVKYFQQSKQEPVVPHLMTPKKAWLNNEPKTPTTPFLHFNNICTSTKPNPSQKENYATHYRSSVNTTESKMPATPTPSDSTCYLMDHFRM